MRFDDLRLTKPLLRAISMAGYKEPTPIQAQTIPSILEGRDVLGCRQTGTGKTAAFALPILDRLTSRGAESKKPSRGVRALVLCPTRELAQQIHDSFETYGQYTGVRQTVVFGGVKQNAQVRALQAQPEVLVATPGRLLDLIGQGLVKVGHTEILVLDEADRMLDMGFLPDLRRIIAQLPKQRQTLLFSATMPKPIRALANDLLHEPVPVSVARVSSPTELVEQWVCHVEKAEKPDRLARLLGETPHTRALVFTRTKHGADKVVRRLGRHGIVAAALHGNKSQNARTRALEGFRTARTPVLVATDIAARGLDVDDISHVINYDLTSEPETYIHRIGRTGRAGATGTAFSFCASDERDQLRAIERLVQKPLRRMNEGTNGQAARSASREEKVELPSAVEGPRSKVKGRRSKVVGPKSKVEGRGGSAGGAAFGEGLFGEGASSRAGGQAGERKGRRSRGRSRRRGTVGRRETVTVESRE